eukprot:TRINITY_DN6766_c0_g1_i10.p1 TRINITY_DN6766_c0_g1~~TRINITY_DN6766_c0_g1_i10.p1  ORF type:complete len:113 (+),score=24.38 TRINITY_DN6766_c0_g1_i10:410-748(+)
MVGRRRLRMQTADFDRQQLPTRTAVDHHCCCCLQTMLAGRLQLLARCHPADVGSPQIGCCQNPIVVARGAVDPHPKIHRRYCWDTAPLTPPKLLAALKSKVLNESSTGVPNT